MSSNSEYGGALSFPITTLQYRDMANRMPRDGRTESEPNFLQESAAEEVVDQRIRSEAELAARIEQERLHAANEVEQRLRKEYEQKLLAARAPIASLIANFEEERTNYYARVEAEIVQLALAISAKILHREAQVDPMLVAALVRLAVERMRDGSTVTLRVAPGRAEAWKQYFSALQGTVRVEVSEDPQLGVQDCLLETELGSAHFGLEAQLKEVEQGFFDLLALRPSSR
jgi:flagellar assembly protein FliH